MKITVKNYEPLPPDLYHFRVIDCQSKTSNDAKQNDFYSWTVEVIEGARTGETTQLATPCELSPLSKSFKFLTAIGLEFNNSQVDVDTNSFIGKDFFADIEIKTSTNDRKRNDFKAIWSPAEYLQKFGHYVPRGGYMQQPGQQPGYPPVGGYPPAGQPGYPPNYAPGYPPNYAPAGQPGYPPFGQPSAGQPGYPPAGQPSAGPPNYAPAGPPNYVPAGPPNYAPAGQPGYPPVGQPPAGPLNYAPAGPPSYDPIGQPPASQPPFGQPGYPPAGQPSQPAFQPNYPPPVAPQVPPVQPPDAPRVSPPQVPPPQAAVPAVDNTQAGVDNRQQPPSGDFDFPKG